MVVIVIVFVTNQWILAESFWVVTDGVRTRLLQIVKSLFGGGGQNIVVAGIVGDSEKAKETLALLGRTIEVASIHHQISVSLIATIVFAIGNRTIGSVIDDLSLDSAGGTRGVVIVKAVLNGLGDTGFGTIIVVGLDNVIIPFAVFAGTIGDTRVGLEELEGGKHSILVFAVDLPSAEFFDLTGARTARSLGLVHSQSEKQKGKGQFHFGSLVVR